MTTTPVLVIAGSTRAARRSPAIAEWVAELGRVASGLSFQVIDLKDLGLGLDDEPGIPAQAGYTLASTIAWSEKVSAACAVIFVTPQYNWGYPAALKNAIDHLYKEWRDKPAIIISYGGHGGGKCAAQLREVLTGVKMRLVEAMPWLRLSRERIEADDGKIDPAADFEAHREDVVNAVREMAKLIAG